MYLKCDLLNFDLRDLQCKFDVILVEPPLEEYSRTQGAVYDRYWNWEEVSGRFWTFFYSSEDYERFSN